MVADEHPGANFTRREVATGSQHGAEALDIWCITDMVLCNFQCSYCVADSMVTREKLWEKNESYERFLLITERLSQVHYKLRLRLQTMGEPFVSREFIERAAWLSTCENICFVELVTNGSLLKKRLKYIAENGDLSKISLWVTFHHTEIALEKFLDEVEYANDLGAFVVVNALAFPDSISKLEELHKQCRKRQLRFNVDAGYKGGGSIFDSGPRIPIMGELNGKERLYALAANKNILDANLRAVVSVDGEPCSAGGDYFIIAADGRVGPCCPLLKQGYQLGNLLDPNFVLKPGQKKYSRCTVDRRLPLLSRLPIVGDRMRLRRMCGNKEDFSHLKIIRENELRSPSLGWFGG